MTGRDHADDRRRPDSEPVTEIRRRHADEIERLKERHRREIETLRGSSRYQIGDALVSIARSPRRLPSTIRRLWIIFRRRRRISAPRSEPRRDHPSPSSDVTIGAVLDEFSWSCFAPEAHLVELDPSTDVDRSRVEECDLVLVESAWSGNRGRWSYLLNGSGSDEPLRALIASCHEASVPAVFWNKEDPVGYDVFLGAARRFPYILTTDADAISGYRRDVPGALVDALPFAAQPGLHNPIGRPHDPLRRVCFAGAWRGEKYPDRARQIDELLGPAHELGALDIYDRYASSPDRERLGFPDPYRTDVLGSLSYDETIDAYRRYSGFLNVNSVTDSPTMFSRRVFEILACGTPVVSTPSQGIDELLGDVVISARDSRASASAVEMLISDAAARDRIGHRGYRVVHRDHTYRRRLRTILDHAGVDGGAGVADPTVAFVCVTNRPERIGDVIEAYERQTYPATRLVLVCNSDDADLDEVRGRVAHLADALVLHEPAERTLGDGLNAAVRAVDCDYVAKIDDDDEYGADYLTDMMLTFGFSGARIVGKRSYYAYLHGRDVSALRFPGNEFRDVTEIAGGTLVFERSLAVEIPFRQLPRGTDTKFLADVRSAGERVFSADRFNFVQHRSGDVDGHTWRIDDEDFLRHCELVGSGHRSEEFFV